MGVINYLAVFTWDNAIRPKSRERSRITARRLMVYVSKSFPHTHIYLHSSDSCKDFVWIFTIIIIIVKRLRRTASVAAGGMAAGKMDSRMSYDRRRHRRRRRRYGKCEREEKKCVRGQVWRVLWLEMREVDLADGSSFAGEKTKK